MPFDDTPIASVLARQTAHHELRVSWTSSAPPGTAYQVYLDKRLAWVGAALVAFFRVPTRRTRVWVGAVAPGEEAEDFSSSLSDPYGSGDRADLTWYGGRYLDPGLVGFRVYASPQAIGFGRGGFGGGGFGDSDFGFGRSGFGRGGFGIGPTELVPLDTIPATSLGRWLDGFGRGRMGEGGFGHAEVKYTWQSGPLGPGAWRFGVSPLDSAGNAGPMMLDTVAISAPPRPPASPGPGLGRLAHSYDAPSRTLTLAWSPSPP